MNDAAPPHVEFSIFISQLSNMRLSQYSICIRLISLRNYMSYTIVESKFRLGRLFSTRQTSVKSGNLLCSEFCTLKYMMYRRFRTSGLIHPSLAFCCKLLHRSTPNTRSGTRPDVYVDTIRTEKCGLINMYQLTRRDSDTLRGPRAIVPMDVTYDKMADVRYAEVCSYLRLV